MFSKIRTISAAAAAILLTLTTSHASETGKLSIELNGLSDVDNGCQMTFVVQNKLDLEVEDLALEVVLFDANAKVIKFVKLATGALPKAKTRVKRFNITGTTCPSIARVLVNDVARCKAGDMTPASCLKAISLSNKSEAQFGL